MYVKTERRLLLLIMCLLTPLEPEQKIKKIRIRENSLQPAATVDDIKSSMMSLRLGTVSPMGMRKATSSQSLNSEEGEREGGRGRRGGKRGVRGPGNFHPHPPPLLSY